MDWFVWLGVSLLLAVLFLMIQWCRYKFALWQEPAPVTLSARPVLPNDAPLEIRAGEQDYWDSLLDPGQYVVRVNEKFAKSGQYARVVVFDTVGNGMRDHLRWWSYYGEKTCYRLKPHQWHEVHWGGPLTKT